MLTFPKTNNSVATATSHIVASYVMKLLSFCRILEFFSRKVSANSKKVAATKLFLSKSYVDPTATEVPLRQQITSSMTSVFLLLNVPTSVFHRETFIRQQKNPEKEVPPQNMRHFIRMQRTRKFNPQLSRLPITSQYLTSYMYHLRTLDTGFQRHFTSTLETHHCTASQSH